MTVLDPRWAGVLDALEADAARVAACAARDEVTGPSYRPPGDLGALPAPLAGRAREVIAALDDVAGVLADQLAAIRAELAQLDRRARIGPPEPERRGGFEAHA